MNPTRIAMTRLFKRTLATLTVAGAVNGAWGFALLGPFDTTFQTVAIGYGIDGDIGGPMNLSEGYRWNVKTIYYGFDPSFMHYFGLPGSNAVVQALETFNKLPAMSKLSRTLSEYPTDTTRINYRAASLGILDLKSHVLAIMLEELGLASPERYVWTLRSRTPIAGTPDFQYVVIQRNFDPVTGAPSQYVNDTLYYYTIQDPIALSDGTTFADAVEFPVDPLQNFTAVVTTVDSIYGLGGISGSYFTGLTRDDVAGLRYLYNKSLANSYVENLVTNAIAGTGGRAFTPVGGTNVLVTTAVRTGVDKFVFKLAKNDSLFGPFIVFTNQNNTDTYFTNSHKMTQTYARAMTQPDIVFAAGDLGLNAANVPFLASRSTRWVNNAALNTFSGTGPTAGPGNIEPGIVITFSKLGPFTVNQGPSSLDQMTAAIGAVWGSYDGTTNEPIVYPQPPGEVGFTVQDLELIRFAP